MISVKCKGSIKEIDGYYLIDFKDLPTCATIAPTKIDAVEQANEKLKNYIRYCIENGIDIPFSDVVENEAGNIIYSLIFEEKGEVQVEKEVTLPAWLVALAEENGIELSEFATERLRKFFKFSDSVEEIV